MNDKEKFDEELEFVFSDFNAMGELFRDVDFAETLLDPKVAVVLRQILIREGDSEDKIDELISAVKNELNCRYIIADRAGVLSEYRLDPEKFRDPD